MKFQCVYCGFPYEVEQKDLGNVARCQNCNKKNIIPNNPYGQGRIIAGDFAIEKLLGIGGMGSVYRVNQISLNRKVALKILLDKCSSDERYRTAFIKESRSVSSLQHVNLTQIYSFGKEGNNSLYLALEYVDGKTLGNLLKDEHLSISNTLSIILQIAAGLEYAWVEKKIVHRDIKPDNILVNSEGVAKLTDMGLARTAEELVQVNEIAGTLSYISPEQLLKKTIDFRSDMYALGIVFYQCLVGKLPFYSKSVKALAKMHIKQVITFPEDIDAPEAVKNLIYKLTAKHPDDRFSSYGSLRNDIINIQLELNYNTSNYDFSGNSNAQTLGRRKTISIEEEKLQILIKKERRNGIILLIVIFFSIACAFIFTYDIINKQVGIANKVDSLLGKINKKTLSLSIQDVLAQVEKLEKEFNEKSRSILEWQAYAKLYSIKNNYQRQFAESLNSDNEQLILKNKIVQLDLINLQSRYDLLKQKSAVDYEDKLIFSLDSFSANNFDTLNILWQQQKNLYFTLIESNFIEKQKVIDLVDLQLSLIDSGFREELLFFRKILTSYQKTVDFFLNERVRSLYGTEVLGGKITSIEGNQLRVLYPEGNIKSFSLLKKKVLLDVVQSIFSKVYRKDAIKILDLFLLSQNEFNNIRNYTPQMSLYIQSYIDYVLRRIDLYSLKGQTEKASQISKETYLKIRHTNYKYYFVNKLKKSFQYYKASISPLKDRLLIRVYK